MRKIAVFLLAAMVCLSFAGCRSNMEVEPLDTTAPATQPITTPPATTIPDTFDDMTNIPDPSVDTEMPIYTEGTDNNANETTDTSGTGMGGK